ncbi:MAG: hypothetical protein KF764_05985 [Labilithrix sp.]|nr:hypothetical protein [Labilithrix sp.]
MRPKMRGASGSTTVRFRVCLLVAVALGGCAPKRDDFTPAIEISPGAKERIMWMDRVRHHGDVRRWLPRVTVEEVDDAELPAPLLDEGTASDASNDGDADAGTAEPPREGPP